MRPRRHSQLARVLIAACGGLDEAAEACRIGKSQLSNAQNPNHDAYLPVDVIADLEAYCGKPHYSSALIDNVGDVETDGDLVGDAIDLNAKAGVFLSRIHSALKDKTITPREVTEIAKLSTMVRQSLGNVDAELDASSVKEGK